MQRARATTKKIETPADLEGFPELKDEEKTEIKALIKEYVTDKTPAKSPASAKKKKGGVAPTGGSGTQTTLIAKAGPSSAPGEVT